MPLTLQGQKVVLLAPPYLGRLPFRYEDGELVHNCTLTELAQENAPRQIRRALWRAIASAEPR